MPTLAAGGTASFALDVLIVLACAAAVTLVLGRIRLGPIPGYLIAGAIIGPSALGFVSEEATIEGISQTAIILLMFGIGLQMSRHELRGGMMPVLMIGMFSTLGTIAIGTPVAMLFGLDIRAAAAIAGAMAMSSTAVVLRILSARGEMRLAHGRIAFGTLISQDLLVIAVLAALPAIAPSSPEITADVAQGVAEGANQGETLLDLLADMMIAIGVIGLTVGAGIFFLPRLLTEAARDSSGELLLVLTAAVALGAAYVTSVVGLSPELGAFVAGFLLAGTPFRYQLAGMLSPMRDLFMAVFFTAVGLQLDLGAVASVWWVVPLAVAALMAVKITTIGLSAWFVGAPSSVAGVAALCLAQAGEFSLVVLSAAIPLGFFETDTAPAVAVAVVVVSLIVAPGVIDLSRQLASTLRKVPSAPWSDSGALTRSRSQRKAQAGADQEEPRERRVVIAGYGPVGRALAERCSELGFKLSIIELNPDTVRTQERLGLHIVYGDVTNSAVLTEAHVPSASAVLLAFRDDDIMVSACRAIRRLNKEVYIAARTDYLSQAMLARGQGANHVTVSEIATAEMMLKQVVDALRGFSQAADQAEAEKKAATEASSSDPQAHPEA